MFTLAHMSDPHLPLAGARPAELASKRILGWLSWTLRRGRWHRRAVLEKVTADMAAAGAGHIALTGDVVNISTRAEFAAARSWLAGLSKPGGLTLVPGNHDFYTRDALAAGLKDLGPWMGPAADRGLPEFPQVRYLRNVALIGLNSAHAAPWGEASGRLGQGQLRRLGELLESCAAKGLCRVVLIHHPPLATLATKPRKALKDAAALEDLLRGRGAEVVLYGHNHVWAHGAMRTASGFLHMLSTPSASMAPGGHRPAGGWQLLRITRRQGAWEIGVERRQLNDAATEMEEAGTMTLNSLEAGTGQIFQPR